MKDKPPTAGSELNHVFLRTTLPVISDRVGQSFANVLTDVSAIGATGASGALQIGTNQFTSLDASWTPRGKLVYQPSLRRHNNMDSNAPIKRVRVEAWYSDNQGRSRQVLLDRGGGFSVKLAFYERKA